MSNNAILKDCQSFMDNLSDDDIEALDALAIRLSESFQDTFSPLDAILYFKAAKALAAVDGLSAAEAERLTARMKALNSPEALLSEVADFDISQIAEGEHASNIEPIVEIITPGSRKAMALIYEAIAIAFEDGFSDNEREAATDIAEWMGVRAEHVVFFEATARLAKVLETHPEVADAQDALAAQLRAFWGQAD